MRESLIEENKEASILASITCDLSDVLDNIERLLKVKGIDYLEKIYVNHNTKIMYLTFFQLEHQGGSDVNDILISNLSPLGFKHDNRKKYSLKYM